MLFYGSSSELIDQYIGKVWAISANNFNHNDYEHVVTSIITEQGKEYRVVSDNPPVQSARPVQPTLEEAYLSLVG